MNKSFIEILDNFCSEMRINYLGRIIEIKTDENTYDLIQKECMLNSTPAIVSKELEILEVFSNGDYVHITKEERL